MDYLILAQSEPLRQALAARLREEGHTVNVPASLSDALRVLHEVPIQIALVERAGATGGGDLRAKIAAARPECRVFLLDSFEGVKRSGNLLNHGTSDFIVGGSEMLRLLAGLDHGAAAESEALRHSEKKARALIKSLDVMVGLQEVDDDWFGGFTAQVTRLARAIAAQMGMDEESQEEIVVSALLRDIGKAGVRHEILEETDRFTPGDLEQMQKHVVWSTRLIEHIDFAWKVLPNVRHHHERYDGSGYPDGLKGRQIPIGARIIAVAESFAAMVSERPHRPARLQEQAIEELMANTGTQFDPEVVEALCTSLERDPSCGPVARHHLIYVVEPEREFRRLLKMRLLQEGYEVIAAGSLAGDMDSLARRAPALVLHDASGGGTAAFECFDALRQSDRESAIPFALLVPEESREFRLQALRRGVDDIIPKSGDLEEIAARVENILTREARRHLGQASQRPAGVRGQLENLPLPDIVQMLGMGGKTACVTLTSGAGAGLLWFLNGAIVHCECGTLKGEAAFYAMMNWPHAEFLIQHGVQTEERTIDGDPILLLMEHFRQADEAGRESVGEFAESDIEFNLKGN